MIRAQYHFRASSDGLLAWDVRRLIKLSSNFPVQSIRPDDVVELSENHWYALGDQLPTCRSIIKHLELIDAADLAYPIILSAEGRLMDGMHRVCKAVRQGKPTIRAVQFTTDPEPDFVGVQPGDLPYD